MNNPETNISIDRLQALVDWKQSLERELKELRTKRDELNEAVSHKEMQIRNLRELLESTGFLSKDAPEKLQTSDSSIADAAYELVLQLGQPLYYKDLASRLVDNGVQIPGRDPHANLLSYMVRDQRFQRIARGTYALAEWGLKTKRSKKRPKSRRKRSRARKG